MGSAPPPPGVTPNFVHPTDVLYLINMATNILCISLVTPFVLLRIYIKAIVVPPFAREDCKLALRFPQRSLSLKYLRDLYFCMGNAASIKLPKTYAVMLMVG